MNYALTCAGRSEYCDCIRLRSKPFFIRDKKTHVVVGGHRRSCTPDPNCSTLPRVNVAIVPIKISSREVQYGDEFIPLV